MSSYAGNWYRGTANWLENRLNGTLHKGEYHDDRVMMRDAMDKLRQAADEIDQMMRVDTQRNDGRDNLRTMTHQAHLAAHAAGLQPGDNIVDKLVPTIRELVAERDSLERYTVQLRDSLAWAMRYVEQVREENPLPYGGGEDIAYAAAHNALTQAEGDKPND